MSTTLLNSAWPAAAVCTPESLTYAPISGIERDRFDGFGVDSAATPSVMSQSVKQFKHFVRLNHGSTVTGSPG
ncbi:hypothetical protein ACIB24_14765 [Spongisporangium articulatum]|uniref:Uncharacterized protein n=1 Tax=Spongisporangium articulatum TaxID=3362603 RepID=A0ABW8APL9_9ACTN